MKRPRRLLERISEGIGRAEAAREAGNGRAVREALEQALDDTVKLAKELNRRVGGRRR